MLGGMRDGLCALRGGMVVVIVVVVVVVGGQDVLDVDREGVVPRSVVDDDVTRSWTRRGSKSCHDTATPDRANFMFFFLLLFLFSLITRPPYPHCRNDFEKMHRWWITAPA